MFINENCCYETYKPKRILLLKLKINFHFSFNLVQLLHKLSIHAANGPVKLMKVSYEKVCFSAIFNCCIYWYSLFPYKSIVTDFK